MLICIIIPVYNYPEVTNTLSAIEEQIATDSRFEIIVVDDASTDETYDIVKQFIEKKDYTNIRLLRHVQNKRIGGARNTGLKHTKADFALFLDADDRFIDGSLKLVIDHLEKQPDLDILMCDYEIIKNGQSKEVFHYKNRNSSVEMSGLRFVELQETPWVAWLYAYRLNFLDSHCLRFEENTLFEDKDFVLESTIKASCIQYMPILLVQYHIHDKQTCNVGSDIEKITALFWNCYRTRCVSERNRIYGQKAFRALMDHHLFAFNSYLKRFFWRLPYMKMREVLTKYPPHCPEKGYLLIWLCVKFPRMFCLITLGAKPWLHLAHAVKRVICA